MKRISHLLLLSIFLASCANAVTPTPNVTVTSQATVTFTPVSTSTATEVLPTPTEVDPNRPIDATGTDSEGNPTKKDEKTGETLTWFPIQYGEDVDKGIKGHWFKSQMKDGKDIFLYDSTLSSFVGPNSDSIPFHQYMLDNNGQLKVGYVLSHPDQVAEFGPGTPLDGGSQSSLVYVYLAVRAIQMLDPDRANDIQNAKDLTQTDWTSVKDHFKSGLSIPVGEYYWNTSKGYDEYIVDYDAAKNDSSFKITTGEKVEFRWKYYIQDGKLVVLIATPDIGKLTPEQMRVMALAPMWEIILNKNPLPDAIPDFSTSGVNAGFMSQMGGTKYHEGVTTNFLEFDFIESE